MSGLDEHDLWTVAAEGEVAEYKQGRGAGKLSGQQSALQYPRKQVRQPSPVPDRCWPRRKSSVDRQLTIVGQEDFFDLHALAVLKCREQRSDQFHWPLCRDIREMHSQGLRGLDDFGILAAQAFLAIRPAKCANAILTSNSLGWPLLCGAMWCQRRPKSTFQDPSRGIYPTACGFGRKLILIMAQEYGPSVPAKATRRHMLAPLRPRQRSPQRA